MAYYNAIAKQWHSTTGVHGGAFKRLVLNELVIKKVRTLDGKSILELGAGNGYFMPLVLRRFSGQCPSRIVITDQSADLLKIAKRTSKVTAADYQLLDVRNPFPFIPASFDLILANMLFNEVGAPVFRHAVEECARVLTNEGRLIFSVVHPAFVESLRRRGQLKLAYGVCTMPGAKGMRLPVVRRSIEEYESTLSEFGFQSTLENVFASDKVRVAKPGLRQARNVPIALLVESRKV